jgi:hypothetical protein
VAFAIEGRLTPIQLCHARRCQKFTGSAFAPELAAKASRLRWIRGEELITVYDAPLLRDPPPLRRAFCRVCGSPLPAPLAGTDYVELLAGVLDDDPGTRPFRHIFVVRRHRGAAVATASLASRGAHRQISESSRRNRRDRIGTFHPIAARRRNGPAPR